jgi:pimeloyl-ACP methyl ester carboxylesterase
MTRGALFLTLAMALVLAGGTSCTSAPVLQAGVVKKACQVPCGSQRVAVDFYFKDSPTPQPMVVVVHGFARSKRQMAGWGADLAARGIVAAVINPPHWANHARNAVAIADLVALGREGHWPVAARGNGKIGLMGFSIGGLTTLLAASRSTPGVDAWVGLDPVDYHGLGVAAAAEVHAPGLALLAEPSVFNDSGNARSMLAAYAGPLQILKIQGATHCDAESPTDFLGQLVVGSSPHRRAIFQTNALAFLEATLHARSAADGLRKTTPAELP